jgi:branched-chain amino acid transport system permease protein
MNWLTFTWVINQVRTRFENRGSVMQAALSALAAGLVVYVLIGGGYLMSVLQIAAIYTIFVTGLNIFMGYAGQVSFGHNAFAAISGYTSAVLTATYGWAPLPAAAVGLAGVLICAALIGYPTLRLRGHYLAMATLAIGLIAYDVAVEWGAVTQGYMGISGIPPFGIWRWVVGSDRAILALLVILAVLGAFAAAAIRHSRLGRALVATAGSENAAKALGIDVAHYKLIAFLISAFYAGVAGSLFVHAVGFVSPEVFGLHMVVLAFTMLYVGGIGTLAGPALGALIVTLLPETFRSLSEYQDLAYGAVLIIILIYAPGGVASLPHLFSHRKPASGHDHAAA